jgi:hypothetical protein
MAVAGNEVFQTAWCGLTRYALVGTQNNWNVELGFMQWTLAITGGLARGNVLGAFAMLSLMLAMIPSARAEGSWCAHKSGTGGSNCGYYSFEQCLAAISGGASFCTQNGFYGHQNHSRTRTRR